MNAYYLHKIKLFGLYDENFIKIIKQLRNFLSICVKFNIYVYYTYLSNNFKAIKFTKFQS